MRSRLVGVVLVSLAVMVSVLVVSCGLADAVSDTQKVAALRNVTMTGDSTGCEFGFPDGALTSGKSFDTLIIEDSATYADAANYSITFTNYMTADNTSSDAEDAKFDGMTVDIVMDSVPASSIPTTTAAFDVAKNATAQTQSTGTINLETHTALCLYIFREVVAGNNMPATLSPTLNYEIGSESGTINVPDIQQSIPTRASPEMQAFLTGLIASGEF